jgi:hypothetical protein
LKFPGYFDLHFFYFLGNSGIFRFFLDFLGADFSPFFKAEISFAFVFFEIVIYASFFALFVAEGSIQVFDILLEPFLFIDHTGGSCIVEVLVVVCVSIFVGGISGLTSLTDEL